MAKAGGEQMAKAAKAKREVKVEKTELAVVPDADFEGDAVAAETTEALDAMELNLRGIEGNLKRVQVAKEGEYKQQADLFWKPQNDGDTIRGVYMGKVPGTKITQYVIATLNPDTGKGELTRFNGTHGLRGKLTPDRVGQGIRLVFRGKSGTSNGRSFKNFDIYWLK